MTMSEPLKEAAELAGLYGLLAEYYKYRDHNTYVYYYGLHAAYTEKAAMLVRELHPPRREELPSPGGSGRETLPHATTAPETPVSAAAAPVVLPRDTSRVRAIHAMPGGSAVDVYLNGRRLLNSITYNATTGYFTVPSGTYRVDLYEAGMTEHPLYSKQAAFVSGASYTLTAAGFPADPDVIVYMDQPFAPPGRVQLRLLHLSPDAPAIDVVESGERLLFPGVRFKDATRYLVLPPCACHLEFRPAGTRDSLLNIPNMRLDSGNAYTIAAIGCVSEQQALAVKLLRG